MSSTPCCKKPPEVCCRPRTKPCRWNLTLEFGEGSVYVNCLEGGELVVAVLPEYMKAEATNGSQSALLPTKYFIQHFSTLFPRTGRGPALFTFTLPSATTYDLHVALVNPSKFPNKQTRFGFNTISSAAPASLSAKRHRVTSGSLYFSDVYLKLPGHARTL